jgi:hypothetical protein
MASCDDDFGLLGDDAHQPATPPPAPPIAQQPAPPPSQQAAHPFSFTVAPAGVAAGAGSFAQVQEDSNHHAESGKPAQHAKRGRERAEEFSSDGGEYCSYINSSGSGGGGKKGCGGGGISSVRDLYRKDREEWTDGAISSLLDAYTDRFEQLNRGHLRGRDWEDVASVVTDGKGKTTGGKSVEQCKNKIDNLKKRYKVECQRLTSSGGGAVSHWPWFKKMEQIVGDSMSPASSKPLAAAEDVKPRQQQQQHGSKRWFIFTSLLDQFGDLLVLANVCHCRYPLSSTGPPTGVGSSRTNPLSNPRWKRVLLKIGGTALRGEAPQNVDPKVVYIS